MVLWLLQFSYYDYFFFPVRQQSCCKSGLIDETGGEFVVELFEGCCWISSYSNRRNNSNNSNDGNNNTI